MNKIELGYSNDFSGKAKQMKCADFTDQNIETQFLLSDNASLVIRNDGAALYTQGGDGHLYVSSNAEYSYSFSVEPDTVTLKF
ncbi:hypothetical protein AB4027_06890 [Alkalibacterium putridalgicola]|uniref:hypothetical protein n=1 Tax=Alkalibacterium putridalgicola TaxID=426703 RepID=UPI0034CDC8BD